LSNVIEVAVGYQNACALTCDGAVYCWGANNLGQLGQGGFDGDAHPLAMPVENL
jgi:alpha-tubulin suppressor-like RCC1 family protein